MKDKEQLPLPDVAPPRADASPSSATQGSSGEPPPRTPTVAPTEFPGASAERPPTDRSELTDRTKHGMQRVTRGRAEQQKKAEPDRGGVAEENLRVFFLEAGYFVVRGGKLRFLDGEVTDVDLWICGRPSRLTRERACVDAKWKQTPKALERVVWAKGLQAMLGLERAIVATPDARDVVRAFGAKHHVTILDGGLFAEIQGRKLSATRMSQEEFLAALNEQGSGKIGGDWRGSVELGASRLVSSLNFDTVNDLLTRVQFFIEKVVASRSPAASRAVYLMTAYFLVAVDYCIAQLAFTSSALRRTAVVDGLRFGQRGVRGTREMIEMSTNLVASYAPGIRERIHADMKKQYDAIPAESLADYLLKPTVQEQLFDMARALEGHAFAPGLTRASNLDTSYQSLLSALLDFMRIDRNTFFNALP